MFLKASNSKICCENAIEDSVQFLDSGTEVRHTDKNRNQGPYLGIIFNEKENSDLAS